jgi:hypothetical protein
MAISITTASDSVEKQQANFIAYSCVSVDRPNGAINWGWRASTVPFFLQYIGVGNWGIVNQVTGGYQQSAAQSGNTTYFSSGGSSNFTIGDTNKYKIKIGGGLSDGQIG